MTVNFRDWDKEMVRHGRTKKEEKKKRKKNMVRIEFRVS